MDDKRKGFFQGGKNPDSRYKNQKRDYQKEDEPLKEIVFRDEKGNLRRALLVKEAEGFAKKLNYGGVSFTQLRNFFNEVLALKEKLKVKPYEEIEAEIGMLVSKANYKKVRERKNTELFKFIKQGVDSIKSGENFKDFAVLFEAVVGFFPRRK
jgi:CRISPR type III-A-associated protein Csm2